MRQIKKHYHWIIAAVIFVQMLIYGGVTNNLSGYHMIPVSETLSITRMDFSLAISIRAVVCAVSAFFSGTLIRRFGYRRIVPMGLGFAAFAYLLLAFTKSYPMLLICGALTGIPDGLCLTAGASVLINNWFRKYRGLVLGAATAATGIGSTLLGIAQSAAIEKVSWRLSFGIVAAVLLLASLLVGVLIYSYPGDLCLRPYGEGTNEKKRKSLAPVGLPMSALKKQPVFYMLILCALLSCVSNLSVSYNIVPYFRDVGFTATQASNMYGIMMFVLGFIKIGMGMLCDRVGTKIVIILCHLSCAVAAVMLLLLPKTELAMTASLLVFALSMPITTIVFPLLSAELLGYMDQGKYIGVVMAMVSTASVISNPIANAVFEKTRSYVSVFWGSALLSLVMVALYGFLFVLSAHMLKKYSAKHY